MTIALVNTFYDEYLEDTEDLLRNYYSTVGWAEGLQRAGASVVVLYRFKEDKTLRINDVDYVFVKDDLSGRLNAFDIPWKFFKAVRAVNADVVHLHELGRSIQNLVLRMLLPQSVGIVIQHHGGKSEYNWKMRVHNAINNVVDGYFFTTKEQGADWFRSSKQADKVMAVMEGGSYFDFDSRDANRTFSYKNRETNKAITGLVGDPVFLWVGRLDDNKDPITVLRGFEMVLEHYPQARLYMIYGERTLEPEVNTILEQSYLLKEQVVLLGKVPHAMLEKYYYSADYFVLGSHYEGSSFSLSEALSCGCIPIVTNIPSFRFMTDEGQIGALWQCDDPASFDEAVRKALPKQKEVEATRCIAFYQQHLSYDAIGKDAIAHYQHIAQRRTKN